MRSIQPLIQGLNNIDEDERRLYDAFKQLEDNIKELTNRRVRNIEKTNLQYYFHGNNIRQSIGAGTYIQWTTEFPQLGYMHQDGAFSNTVVTIRRSGVYIISTGVVLSEDDTGTFREIEIELTRDGVATFIASNRVGIGGAAVHFNGPGLRCTIGTFCYADDVIKVIVRSDHTSGFPVFTSTSSFHNYIWIMERREELTPAEYGLFDPDKHVSI